VRHGDLFEIFSIEDELTMKHVKHGHAEELGLKPLGRQ
jgi:hypothetical protein